MSSPLVLTVWLVVLGFEWIPLNILRANIAGPVIVLLHAAGIVLAWLPVSNRYVLGRHDLG